MRLDCIVPGKSLTNRLRPNETRPHLRVILDELSTMEALGATGLPEALHEAAERIRQRALVVVISDLFVETKELSDCFQHLRFRKHDAVVFHLLEQSEIDFEFDRPMRFMDLEGGSPVLADPSIVANEYRKAVNEYLTDLKKIMRDAAVDYQRLSLDQHLR